MCPIAATSAATSRADPLARGPSLDECRRHAARVYRAPPCAGSRKNDAPRSAAPRGDGHRGRRSSRRSTSSRSRARRSRSSASPSSRSRRPGPDRARHATSSSDDGASSRPAARRRTSHVPLAHTEGGLTASMTRGALAAGAVRTYVLARPDHPRVVLRVRGRGRRGRARALDRGRAARDARVARDVGRSVAVEAREAARREDARGRADVPRALAVDDRRRGRAEHDDPQRVRAEHGVRHAAGAGASRSARSSRRTWAATRSRPPSTSSPATGRRCSPRRSSPTSRSAACSGRRPTTSRRSRGQARTARSRRGMQSVAFTPASAIAAVFAATGQDLGMVGTSSMAHGTGRRVDGGLQATIRFAGLEVGHGRRRHDAAVGARLARVDRLRRPRQGLPLRADRRGRGPLPRDQRLGGDGDRRQRELLPGAPRARRPCR